MIPTMILVGLVLGLLHYRSHHRGLATIAAAVAMALAFGIVVGEVLGGATLALVNIFVGGLSGFAIEKLGRVALGIPMRPQRRQP